MSITNRAPFFTTIIKYASPNSCIIIHHEQQHISGLLSLFDGRQTADKQTSDKEFLVFLSWKRRVRKEEWRRRSCFLGHGPLDHGPLGHGSWIRIGLNRPNVGASRLIKWTTGNWKWIMWWILDLPQPATNAGMRRRKRSTPKAVYGGYQKKTSPTLFDLFT